MSAHDRVSPRVVIATAAGAVEPVPASHRPLTRSRRPRRVSPHHHSGRARPRDQGRGPLLAPDRPPTAPVGRRSPSGSAGANHDA